MQRPLAQENWLGEQVRAGQVRQTDRQTEHHQPAAPREKSPPQALKLPPTNSSPEQVELDSSSLFPQSLSPSHSQRLGMQRLFLHLKRSEGQVCWSVEGGTRSGSAYFPPPRPPISPRRGYARHSSGASSLLSRQSLSPSHFQRSWMQRLFLQANSPGWH